MFKSIMWFLFESSPEKRLKRQLSEMEMFYKGSRQRKKALKELAKLEIPRYEVPEKIEP